MAQQHYLGVRLDGQPFEEPDLDNFQVESKGRQTRNNSVPTEYTREPGKDINDPWFQNREKRGAVGNPTLGSQLKEFLLRWLFLESDKSEDQGDYSLS